MYLELYVHVAHLRDLLKGSPVNCKINFPSQYDMRIMINVKKYIIISSNTGNNNLITLRKKTLIDYLHLRGLINKIKYSK